ncbi:expressed unknown protein [Seminavis robusta]|uniref:Uncharacterized protein n=1 Tax=Seminavis robusta TaxID=568900 RepID=A0A9N8HQK8_9STRA|nr:expressed unknown protein [Seminavis robusta]|eukprot:Sro1455_g274130.1 n/a (109) ;mRNA; f:7852-8178
MPRSSMPSSSPSSSPSRSSMLKSVSMGFSMMNLGGSAKETEKHSSKNFVYKNRRTSHKKTLPRATYGELIMGQGDPLAPSRRALGTKPTTQRLAEDQGEGLFISKRRK